MSDRLSLRWRIPAIIGLILAVAMVTLSVLAYSAAKRSAIEAATERIDRAADRVAELSSTSMRALLRRADSVASHPAVVNALRNPGKPLTPEAHAAMRRLRPDTAQRVKIGLFDAQGRPVEGVAPELVPEGPVERPVPIDQPVIQPFRQVPGGISFLVAVPVRDSGKVIGQLVQWRQVTRVTASLRLLTDLIGRSATLLIGNTDGSLVTEMSDTLRPPVIRDEARTRQALDANVQVSSPIAGTPWSILVEYPYANILGPLKVLSGQSIVIAVLVLVLAMLAAALLSRGVTSSLAELTTTAEFIAGGDLSRRPVEVGRRDEVGRLARSFSAMADSIRDSHDQLERRIQARTADLQAALTQLRDTQDELLRKEKLATIGQLASSVGHELRNPLGVMMNAVYILERNIDAPSPKTQECLRLLNAQIKLSERIVTDLLDSARSKSAQRRLVDVPMLLADQLQRVTVPPNVRVELSVDKGLPKTHVDPDQVGQILVNLLTNAAQAMTDKPGVLSVRARNGQGRIRIDVRDNGPGVPVDLTEKIFEPLYTTKARGIGLGLSVSRSLAVANDGSLTVVNHPDGGAVFTLELPAGGAE